MKLLIIRNLAQTPRLGKRVAPDGIIAGAMNAPSARATSWFRYADAAVFATCVAIAWLVALRFRQDASFDLQNYHFYDPWAWLERRSLDWDVAAAQLQTFHNPMPDVPFYLLVKAGIDPRAITAWLALPTGAAGYLFIKSAWLLFADLRFAERAGATAAAAAIGFTGAMGIGQLGSTTDEWLVTAFTMAALWLLLREPSSTRAGWPLVLAGLSTGLASGLKLTAATYAVGLCAGLMASRAPVRETLRAVMLYCSGVASGLALALGPWSYQLWTHFRNPLFPYGNQWFGSPWWDAGPVLERSFGPHTIHDALLLPFRLLAPPPGFVSEMHYVDARLPLLGALALIAAGGYAIARTQGAHATVPPSFRTTSGRWRTR
jgi:hypothetical protein